MANLCCCLVASSIAGSSSIVMIFGSLKICNIQQAQYQNLTLHTTLYKLQSGLVLEWLGQVLNVHVCTDICKHIMEGTLHCHNILLGDVLEGIEGDCVCSPSAFGDNSDWESIFHNPPFIHLLDELSTSITLLNCLMDEILTYTPAHTHIMTIQTRTSTTACCPLSAHNTFHVIIWTLCFLVLVVTCFKHA